jgi:hypothetical protein
MLYEKHVSVNYVKKLCNINIIFNIKMWKAKH